MFGLKNDEILTYFLLIVVGYCIAKMFSKSCNGFSVGVQNSVVADCENIKNKLIMDFNDFEKGYSKWGFDKVNKVWIKPADHWPIDSYDPMKKYIDTPGCNFPEKYFIRDSDGIITDISDISEPTIHSYFPITI